MSRDDEVSIMCDMGAHERCIYTGCDCGCHDKEN